MIRMARIGTKNHPFYRIVICEKGRDNYGNMLDTFGTYDPYSKILKVEAEKVKEWISKGAQMTPTVNNLFINNKIIEGEKAKTRKVNTVKLMKKREEAVKAENDAKIKAEADKKATEEAAKAAQEAEKLAAEAAKIAAETPVEAPVSEVAVEEKPAEEAKVE